MQIGLTSYSLGNSLPVLPKQVAAILHKFGSDAHLYMPGPGVPVLGPELVGTITGDGATLSGGTLTENSATSSHGLSIVTPYKGAVSYSVRAKAGSRSFLWMYFANYSAGSAWFNLATGTVATSEAGVVASISPSGDGYYNCTITKTTGNSNNNVGCFAANASWGTSYSGNGSVALYIDNISVKELLGYTNKIDGFTTGNYLESTGNTNASVDGAVGLVLDAAGSVGAELVAGNGSTISGWTFANATGAIVNGELVVTATGTGTATATYLASHPHPSSYRYSVFVSQTSRGLDPYCAGASTGAWTTVGTKTGHVNSGNATEALVVFMPGSLVGETFKLSAVSVKEITGTHATQATTANKPTLRRGIVNLLTYSNDLTNEAWALRGGVGASRSTGVPDPFGGNSAVTLGISTGQYMRNYQSAFPAAATGTVAFWLRSSASGGASNVRITTNDATAWNTGFSQKISLTSQWQLVAVSGVVHAANTIGGVVIGAVDASNANDDTCLGNVDVYCAGLFQGTLTAQQILDAGGIPLTTTSPASSSAGKYAWQFDGVDDRLTLGVPLFQMTDDHCVIAGFKSNKTQCSIVAPSTATNRRIGGIGVNSGGVLLCEWYDGTNYIPLGVGASIVGQQVVGTAMKRGNTLYARLNGVPGVSGAAFSTAEVMTGGLIGDGPLGASNGNIYAVIAIKGTVSDADLKTLEKWIGSLAGVQIQ